MEKQIGVVRLFVRWYVDIEIWS